MLVNTENVRRHARRVLPRLVFDGVDGAADDGGCIRRNSSDLHALALLGVRSVDALAAAGVGRA